MVGSSRNASPALGRQLCPQLLNDFLRQCVEVEESGVRKRQSPALIESEPGSNLLF
jgi:hypothetical protein